MPSNAVAVQRRPRDASPALRLVQSLEAALADWRADEVEFEAARSAGDLPRAKNIVARIAAAPEPRLDADVRRALVEPVGRADALRGIVLATAALAGRSSQAESRAYLRDVLDTTLDAGASLAELHLVHRWLRTRAGSPGRPAHFPTFTFRPSAGTWDEALHHARGCVRRTVDALDRRAARVRDARDVLASWPAIESRHAERVAEARAAAAAKAEAEAERINAASRRQAEVRAKREAEREDWLTRHRRLTATMDAHRASLPKETRECLDAAVRKLAELRATSAHGVST